MRNGLGVVFAVWLLAGCSTSTPPPTGPDLMLTQAQQCMRAGGWWRQSLGTCDLQSTGRH